MACSSKEIVEQLEYFMDQHGRLGMRVFSFYSDWYVGISQDADRRLREHNALDVPHKVMTATSAEMARAVEHYFRLRGCYVGPGGGTNPNKVYAYRMKEGTTRP